MSDRCEWKSGEFFGCSDEANNLRYSAYCGRPFTFCPFCGADIRKPVDIKVGMFGTYANRKEDLGYKYGVLKDIKKEETDFFVENSRSTLERAIFFTPGLPEGFNQDGTPK